MVRNAFFVFDRDKIFNSSSTPGRCERRLVLLRASMICTDTTLRAVHFIKYLC